MTQNLSYSLRKSGGIGTKGVVKREKRTFGAGSGTVGVVAQRLPCRIFGLRQVKAYLAEIRQDLVHAHFW